MSRLDFASNIFRSFQKRVGNGNRFKRNNTKIVGQFPAQFSTCRSLNTKIAAKRSICKPQHSLQRLRFTKGQYIAFKRRLHFGSVRRRVMKHRRSIFRVIPNIRNKRGYSVVRLPRRRTNGLEDAVDLLPKDLLRHVLNYLPHDSFLSLPAVNQKVCKTFEPIEWRKMLRQRLTPVISGDIRALWSFASTRGRVGPCSFGRTLSMQSARACVLSDGSLEFYMEGRGSPRGRGSPGRTPGKKVMIMFDRVFDFQMFFSRNLRFPDEESVEENDMRCGRRRARAVGSITDAYGPESAFRIASISGGEIASPWQKLIVRKLVSAVNEENYIRAPALMANSTLGEKLYVLPRSFR